VAKKLLPEEELREEKYYLPKSKSNDKIL